MKYQTARALEKLPLSRSQPWMRVFATAPLILYPAGCVLLLLINEREGFSWIELAGFSPILLSMICFIFILPSYFSRITTESGCKLDEYELDLRRRAMTFAYQAFGGLTLIGLMYVQIATDAAANPDSRLHGIWLPKTGDHWSAILWGAILCALLLPTTYLAWTTAPPLEEED